MYRTTLSFFAVNYKVFRFNSFLYVVNDTATTEIYTLSLHDALPILLSIMKSFGSDRL